MLPGSLLPDESSRRTVRRRCLAYAFALAVTTAAASLSALAEGQTIQIDLKPHQIQTVPIALEKNQIAKIHLQIQSGLVGIRATLPNVSERPVWKIDLGRGGQVVYVVGPSAEGEYALELSSFEQEKTVRLSVHIDQPVPADQSAVDLRDAEDALANADLVRNRMKTAIPGLDAEKSYDRALALATGLNDTPLKRLILTEKARFLIFRRSRFKEAQALLEEAVALPSNDDTAGQALAWKTLSTVRYDLGEYLAAIKANSTSLSLYRTTGDLYWQGIVLGNLASDYAELGQDKEALSAAQEALRDAEQEHDNAGVVYCLAQVADLYRQQGDLEGALHAFHESLAWIGEIGYAPLIEAEIQKDLGSFYAQIGNWDLASSALQRCLELEGKQSDPVSLEARGLLADVMQHQGRLRDAVAQDTTAIEAARTLSLKHEEATILLKRSASYLSLNRATDANADIDAASQLATELSALPLQIEAAVALGNAKLSVDPKAAESSYRKALQLAVLTGEREQQSVALAGVARAQQRQSAPESAVRSIEEALKILEASRSGLGSRELQVTYFAMHRSWYELAVDLCMQLHGEQPEKGYAQMAFSYTERARARALLDTLLASGYTSTASIPDNLREAYARNRQTISDQQAILSHGTSQSIADIVAKLKSLYLEQDALEAEMQSSDRRLTTLPGSQAVDLPTLQRQLLEPHSVLLAYWLGENHSYRWVITSDRIAVNTLPPQRDLNRTILPLEGMLRARRPGIASGEDIAAYTSRQLSYETTLRSALTRAGSTLLSGIPTSTHTIFVVSDGSLMSLPFAALRIPDGKAGIYAICRYTFFAEPSASVAAYLKQHPAPEQPLRMAVFADPVFSRDDPRFAPTSKPATAPPARLLFANMPRLTDSREEARHIVQLAPSGAVTLRVGFDANPEQVRALKVTDASILHFATHTVSVAGHPEISGIALSMVDRDGKDRDGVFWLKDIYELHQPVSLVVLSGCTTDNLDNDPGEGLNSVARAFFFSGVHSVIGSLWTVSDKATSQLMEAFYRNLLVDHQRADEALRSAQLRLLANPQTSAPSTWAPFVLSGWPTAYGSHASETGTVYTTTSSSSKPSEPR